VSLYVCACPGSVTELLAVCECETTMALALPPVLPGVYVVPAPTTNLSRKSGVLLAPLHNNHPVGILATEPDHMTMTPVGTKFSKLFATKAVVATCVLLVPLAAVGAVATPLSVDVPPIDKLPPCMFPVAVINPPVTRLPPCTFPVALIAIDRLPPCMFPDAVIQPSSGNYYHL
jgi:hypothetical protein